MWPASESTGFAASLEGLQDGGGCLLNFSSFSVVTTLVIAAEFGGEPRFPMAALLNRYIDVEQQKKGDFGGSS